MVICYEIIKPKYMIWSLEQNRWLWGWKEGNQEDRRKGEGMLEGVRCGRGTGGLAWLWENT